MSGDGAPPRIERGEDPEMADFWKGTGTYWWTFAGLLALTLLTFGLSFLGLGPWGRVLAVLIGAAKALLVLLFFMHLVEHRTSSRVAFGVAAAFTLVLVTLTALDVNSRERARFQQPGPSEEPADVR